MGESWGGVEVDIFINCVYVVSYCMVLVQIVPGSVCGGAAANDSTRAACCAA